MTLVFILLACAGLMFILKYGSILHFIRAPLVKINFFNELFKCALCLGFWSGMIVGSFVYAFSTWDSLYYLLPLASAAFCWSMDGIVGIIQWSELYMESKNKK